MNIKKTTSDEEAFYQEYLNYQNGDKTALGRIFVESKDNLQELTDKYYSHLYGTEYMDNVLDSDMIKANIQDEQKKHDDKVTFRFACLKKMLNKAKWEYSQESINTGDNSSYKKFHEGKYDILEINEMLIEVIIKIFQNKLSSKYAITDAESLLGNIKYHLTTEIGKENDRIYKDISDIIPDTEGEEEEEHSYFDKISENIWTKEQGEVRRLLVYADCLRWIENNDIHRLFKKDAKEIHSIIGAIMKAPNYFGSVNQEGMTKETYKYLREFIYNTTKENILDNNISRDLKIIEQNLLDHLLYSLNYEIGKPKESEGYFSKESERFLRKMDPQRYFKLFGRESMDIYCFCKAFLKGRYTDSDFKALMRKYDVVTIPILEKEKGQKKYDMINVLTYKDNKDVMESDEHTALYNIADTLTSHYDKKEKECVCNLLDRYKVIDRFIGGKSRYWQADFRKKKSQIKIKFFADETTKNPAFIKIQSETILLYEGYSKYYFCDTEQGICYCVPKDKRIIKKSDADHNSFVYKIA